MEKLTYKLQSFPSFAPFVSWGCWHKAPGPNLVLQHLSSWDDPSTLFGGFSSLRNIICLAATFPLTRSIFSIFGSSCWQSHFSWTNYSAYSGLFHHNQRWARVFILCMQLEVIPFDCNMERQQKNCGSSLTWIFRRSHALVFQICLIGHLLFIFSAFNQIIRLSTIIIVTKKPSSAAQKCKGFLFFLLDELEIL